MWVCHCNAFNDKALDRAIADVKDSMAARGEPTGKRPKTSEVYRQASNGNRPNCGTCLDTIKGRINASMAGAADENTASLPTTAKHDAPANDNDNANASSNAPNNTPEPAKPQPTENATENAAENAAAGRWNPDSSPHASDKKQLAAISPHAPAPADFKKSGCTHCSCGAFTPSAPRP